MKKALLLGASGFIGSFLLEQLLDSPDYDQVTVVARKELKTKHPKLRTFLGDLSSLPRLKNDLRGDDVFIAMGTTRKTTPDLTQYVKIDHDYPVLFARFAKENGAKAVFMVTAVGADVGSRFFYTKLKGEIERDLIALGFEHTHIFRPSMLLGTRVEHRPLEQSLIGVFRFINPVFAGPLSVYRGVEGKDVARAMVRAAQTSPAAKVKIHHWSEMMAEKS